MNKTAILELAIVLLFCVPTYTAIVSSAPEVDKTKIVTKVRWGQEPIELVDLRLRDKPIGFDSPFISTDDTWVRELRFKIKNISEKSITDLRIELQFPLKDSPRQTYYVEAIEYGKSMALATSDRAIKPGEAIELASDSVNMDVLKRVVKEKGQGKYLNLNHVLISTEIVSFDDKTNWTAGQMLRFDLVNRKWTEIGRAPDAQDAAHFLRARFAGNLTPNVCYKATIEDQNCNIDCGSGGVHHTSVPGEDGGSNNPVDKFQRCTTNCVIAYSGLTPGCVP